MRHLFAVAGLLLLARAERSVLHELNVAAYSEAADSGSCATTGQSPAELMAAASAIGEVPAWENRYVRVHYVQLQYPPAEPRVAASRPVVLYVRVSAGPGLLDTHLLDAPGHQDHWWRQGTVPRGVRIELLAPPPPPPGLGEPGTDPPPGAIVEEHERYRFIVATFGSMDFGVGAGRLPSVTTFLSDGVIDVTNRGVRRRMGVRAGDAFWFEAATRLTVFTDDPVGAAIVQLRARTGSE